MSAPRSGQAYTFYASLYSTADGRVPVSNPTLAAGDVQISKDGGAYANITTLPTVATASDMVVVSLSATEMTVTNACVVRFKDQAGSEWLERKFVITV